MNKKTNFSKKPRRKPKAKPKRTGNRRGQPVTAFGETFDSKTEFEAFMILKSDKSVKHIEVHPGPFQLIPDFEVQCGSCFGSGRQPSEKRRGKTVNCERCDGKSVLKRGGRKYTPDFHVKYHDGTEEYIDAKGSYIDKTFPYYKTMFEWITRKQLIIMQKTDEGGFVRK